MPEVPICQHCKRSVDVETDDYVIPNKAVDHREWTYEHVDCYDETVTDAHVG